jgi:hypothetical protein
MQDGDYEMWTAAAAKAAEKLNLPSLTIGKWARMILNQASRALGVEPPLDKYDDDERPQRKSARVDRLAIRTSVGEYDAWTMAAATKGKQMGLANLTIGPWARTELNKAAKKLGVTS